VFFIDRKCFSPVSKIRFGIVFLKQKERKWRLRTEKCVQHNIDDDS